MEQKESVYIRGVEFFVERLESRGRYSYAEIRDNTIRIKIPDRVAQWRSDRLFEELKNNSIKRLEKEPIEQIFERARSKNIEFSEGKELTIFGNKYHIKINERENAKRSSVSIKEDTITITPIFGLSGRRKIEYITKLAKRNISRHFISHVKQRIDSINSANFNFQVNSIRLKNQTTRWGSCSKSSKSINLNLRLLFGPTAILDYVIIHELSHLKHSNHSKTFWNLVGSVIPDYKQRAKWLRKNGGRIGIENLSYP